MRLHYTGFMARNTTPKAANKAVRKTKSGKPKPGKPRAWTPAEVEEAFRRFRQASPEPNTELQSVNPFTLLVAVVLSAQATDAGVNKATPALFAVADNPARMAARGEVVLNIAFGEPTIAVDTHIFRVGNRTGLAPGKTPLEVETKLEQRVPDRYK